MILSSSYHLDISSNRSPLAEPTTMTLLLPFIILLLFSTAVSCPTNSTLLSLCTCTSSNNGIVLDCSDSDAGMVKDSLIENQAQLGLIQQLVSNWNNQQNYHIASGYAKCFTPSSPSRLHEGSLRETARFES